MLTRRTFFASTAALACAAGLPALAMDGRSGTFEGRSTHKSGGSVSVVTENGQTVVRFGDDYVLDGAPDPVVGFSNGEVYDPATFLGELKAMAGTQDYVVPEGIDASAYGEVMVWCRAADVPLSVAALN